LDLQGRLEIVKNNIEKSLKKIVEAKENIELLNSKIETIEKQIEDKKTEPDTTKIDNERKAIEIELEKLKNNINIEFGKRKQELKESLDFTLKDLEEKSKVESKDNEKAELEEKIKNLEALKQNIQKQIAEIRASKKIVSRIEELKTEEEELATVFEEKEKALQIIERFYRKRSEYINLKAQGTFQITTFKLFETQINEGLNPVCETVVNGIPYASLNNANRIKVGMDILQAFGKSENKVLPIFIDNAESITEVPETENQQILLVVKKGFDKLTMED